MTTTGPGASLAARLRAGLAVALSMASLSVAAQAVGTVETYRGSCDASAAVALGSDRFVVANDENNMLGFYRRGVPQPDGSLSLSDFLGAQSGDEVDIEGAAAIGERVYWIASHSRNSKGKRKPARLRLFATDIRAGDPATLSAAGRPYQDLLRDLTENPGLQHLNLAAAAKLAAEADGGLNIEGLAATPDGRLLIGFRNPLQSGRALVVPLDNPAQVVAGERARLGTPIELDLQGRGIRSFERRGMEYLLVAGPTADEGTFSLYRWSGVAGEPATELKTELGSLRPEALFSVPDTDHIQLLSDDGGVMVAGRECKSLPASEQRFRSLTAPVGRP